MNPRVVLALCFALLVLLELWLWMGVALPQEVKNPRAEVRDVDKGGFEWRMKSAARTVWDAAKETWPKCERIIAVLYPSLQNPYVWIAEGLCVDHFIYGMTSGRTDDR